MTQHGKVGSCSLEGLLQPCAKEPRARRALTNQCLPRAQSSADVQGRCEVALELAPVKRSLLRTYRLQITSTYAKSSDQINYRTLWLLAMPFGTVATLQGTRCSHPQLPSQ